MHFITFAVVDWVDVFTRMEYRDIVVESLRYCQQKKGLNLHGWTLMSNHIHLIISARDGYSPSEILRDFKKFTSYHILRAIEQNSRESRRDWMLQLFKKAGQLNSRNATFQFWQQDNQPKELNSNEMLDQKLNYIHNNAVEAGLVVNAEDWLYSSAVDYAGGKGLLKIVFLD